MLCVMPAGCTSAPTAPPTNGETKQFYRACENDDLKTVKKLLNTRSNVQLIDATMAEYGESPLHWAVNNKHLDIVKLLVKHGADVNVADEMGITPLHMAADSGSVEMAKFLIDNGADIKARMSVIGSDSGPKNADGETPLHWAANYEVGLLLVEKGADVNDKPLSSGPGEYQQTPIYNAIERGSVELVRLLVQKGATVQMKDRMDKTPLDAVCFVSGEGKYEIGSHAATMIAQILVAHGANANQDFVAEVRLQRPLSVAAGQSQNLELVKFLVAKGASVNPRCTEYGDDTPLMQAVGVEGNKDVVQFLIDKGANVNATSLDDSGRARPLDYAADNAIRQILHRHGAKHGTGAP